MDISFEDSFTEFLRKNFTEDLAPVKEKGHFYRKEDGRFIFPEHRLEIVLVPAGRDFPENGPYGLPVKAGPDGECVPAVENRGGGEILSGIKETNKQEIETAPGTRRDILYLYEDRWRRSRQLTAQRVLARLGHFRSVFARKCKAADVQEYCRMKGARSKVEIKKCVNEFNGKIREFLESYHQYGYAKCRYKYMLLYENEIVAVATFSAPRPMVRFRSRQDEAPYISAGQKSLFLSREPQERTPVWNTRRKEIWRKEIFRSGEYSRSGEEFAENGPVRRNGKDPEGPDTAGGRIRPAGGPGAESGLNRDAGAGVPEYMIYRSYEWVRYASLPDVRVAGGMGKLLNVFLREAEAKDGRTEVMTYSDNEWSEGAVYRKLGFFYAGERAPVEYFVNKHTWERFSVRRMAELFKDSLSGNTGIKIPEEEPGKGEKEERDEKKERKEDREKNKNTAPPLAEGMRYPDDFYRIANKGSRKFLYRPSFPGKEKD